MKLILTAETRRVTDVSLNAANDSILRESNANAAEPAKPRTAALAWDPHEVWRTRILPYQLKQRLMAADRDR